MIYAAMLGLALVLMLPLFVSLFLKGAARNRRETAIVLHRAQLDELARDLAEGRIAAQEYAGAKLEVERRLLAADALAEPAPDGNARLLLIATAVLVPVMAFALYLPGSTPNVPSEPHAKWVAEQQNSREVIADLITQLRAHLATIDPNSPEASEGQAYLAEALAEEAGQLTPESIALFKQSIANAPANAPWRALDEERLVQASVTP
jgi:cytochrome c-type biogenesis protein CcmH